MMWGFESPLSHYLESFEILIKPRGRLLWVFSLRADTFHSSREVRGDSWDTPEQYEVLPLRLLRSERHQDRHDHLVLDAPCTRLDSNEGLQIDCLEL